MRTTLVFMPGIIFLKVLMITLVSSQKSLTPNISGGSVALSAHWNMQIAKLVTINIFSFTFHQPRGEHHNISFAITMKNSEARPLNKMEYFCIGENISMLENICERFPVLCEKILSNLDDKNLVNIKVVSRKICNLVQNERLFWIRSIKKLIGGNYEISEKWQQVINKTPSQIVKELAIAVSQVHETYKNFTDYNENVINMNELSPLHMIALLNDSNLDLFRLILEKIGSERTQEKNGWSPLHIAVMNDNLELTKLIIKSNGKNVENQYQKDKHGRTPLHLAVNNRNVELCNIFLANAGDNSPGYVGQTPFHFAANLGNMKICKLFIEKFPIKNPADDNGITPLHNAAKEGNFDLFMLIAQSIFDINPKTNNGSTPLHFAAYSGHYNICQVIIEHDGTLDKNPQNRYGETPFHKAAAEGHYEVCKLIIENVLDKNPRDNTGDTPLHKAAENGHMRICALIVEKAGKKSPVNDDGETPYDHALENEQSEICKFLTIDECLPLKRQKG